MVPDRNGREGFETSGHVVGKTWEEAEEKREAEKESKPFVFPRKELRSVLGERGRGVELTDTSFNESELIALLQINMLLQECVAGLEIIVQIFEQ